MFRSPKHRCINKEILNPNHPIIPSSPCTADVSEYIMLLHANVVYLLMHHFNLVGIRLQCEIVLFHKYCEDAPTGTSRTTDEDFNLQNAVGYFAGIHHGSRLRTIFG